MLHGILRIFNFETNLTKLYVCCDVSDNELFAGHESSARRRDDLQTFSGDRASHRSRLRHHHPVALLTLTDVTITREAITSRHAGVTMTCEAITSRHAPPPKAWECVCFTSRWCCAGHVLRCDVYFVNVITCDYSTSLTRVSLIVDIVKIAHWRHAVLTSRIDLLD